MATTPESVRAAGLFLLPLLVLFASACAESSGGTVTAPAEPVTAITITSPGLSFDIEAFKVPVGQPVELTYDNADDGVLHNIHIDTGTDDEPQTELVEGPEVRELTFTIADAGEYTYLCDVHAAQMRGTVTVVPT